MREFNNKKAWIAAFVSTALTVLPGALWLWYYWNRMSVTLTSALLMVAFNLWWVLVPSDRLHARLKCWVWNCPPDCGD